MSEERSSGDSAIAATVTVVLVDNEPLIRTALARTLSDSGIEVVGEAATGEDAIELVLDIRPDIVLTAINLPGSSGLEAIEPLSLLAPHSRRRPAISSLSGDCCSRLTIRESAARQEQRYRLHEGRGI